MKIDGRLLATTILHHLKETITQNHLTPHLAIILVGDNPASHAYAIQKQKKAHDIGAKATIWQYESTITSEVLLEKITKLNSDPSVSGIIVQRPLPKQIDEEKINQSVIPEKDIDAFHRDSSFENPLVKAVLVILTYIHTQTERKNDIKRWLAEKNIVIIGKGETGGAPIITYLKTQGIDYHLIDSTTTNPENILQQADIIISAVGKEIIMKESIKKGVILVGIGQHKMVNGNFSGDYTDEEITNIASWYTPTPGGVGPLTVACLLENLVKASE